MLSYISFILAFALVASGTVDIEGNWRYEGQFVAGNPKLQWDKAGWKLLISRVNIMKVPGNNSYRVHFTDPSINVLNDRLREDATWTQIYLRDWMETNIKSLQKPIEILFENGNVKECYCDKGETRDSIDIKLAFADHLKAAMASQEGEQRARNILGRDMANMKVEQPVKAGPKKGNMEISNITYYHTGESLRLPIVGVIPIKSRCIDCQSPKRRVPLDTYNKIEVQTDGKQVVSILRQNVVTLPLYKIDSPVYSIFGNISLIRVGDAKPIPITNAEKKTIKVENIKSHNEMDLVSKVVTLKEIQEAVKLIRAIVSIKGEPRREENIVALFDMLSANELLITSVEEHLETNAERNVFYSMISTQESHYALEVLINATKSKKIPVSCVPVYMLLSSKISEVSDIKTFIAIHEFIQSIKKECPLCATVSYLALSILIRRNAHIVKPEPYHKSDDGDKRLDLAMAGNIGLDMQEHILPQNVILKMAYVQSKRNPRFATPWKIIDELVHIFLDNKEATIVRAEAFKVVMGLSCNKTVLSTIFAELNRITDPVLISYVISYMESYASNKVPFYKFMTEQIKTQIPLMKAAKPELSESILAKHATWSVYSHDYNMGVALLSDYILPEIVADKYMTASVEIQPYLMNTLLSAIKVQVIAPVSEMKSLIEAIRDLIKDIKLGDPQRMAKLLSLLPHLMDIIKKSEVKVFNDNMEIGYVSSESSLGSIIRSMLNAMKPSGKLRGVIVPVNIKKYVHSIIGPHVEMSILNYMSMDTIYEYVPDRRISIIPRISAGMRLRLQSADKITINAGTELKVKMETRNITLTVNKTKNSIHLKTFIPLQISPMATLEVIPTTGSTLGVPKRVYNKRNTPSLDVKSVPIAIIKSLDDPSVVLNISGKVEKPVENGMLYGLLEPQYLQLSLLPTYNLPSDVVVFEYVHSEGRCHSLDYCLLKEDKSIKPIKRCCRFCLNSVLTDDTIATGGSTLEIYQKNVSDAVEVVVRSRIHLANESRLGLFEAEAALSYPSLIKPVDLLNKTYIDELKQHEFISLRPMQLTLNETEMTRQIHEINSGIYLPVSRSEDYTDMNQIIMALYPHLYVEDTLKIDNLHNVFKTLLNIATKAVAAKGQTYEPKWDELKAMKDPLMKILDHPLTEPTPEVIVMQDQVILWCIMQYFEIGYNYLDACNGCDEARTFIDDTKATVLDKYFTFFDKSNPAVIAALQKSSNDTMKFLIGQISQAISSMRRIINSRNEHEIVGEYRHLFNIMGEINRSIKQLSNNQMKKSRLVMKNIINLEMFKSIADHWQFDGTLANKKIVQQETLKTDLAVSFTSVVARVIIQAFRLLSDNSFSDRVRVNELISQSIMLLDYVRLLRTSYIDAAQSPHVITAAKELVLKTKTSLDILKTLPSTETLDPAVMIFITEVIAMHRLTLVELKNLPSFVTLPGLKLNTNQFEWTLIWILKNVLENSRPLSTLKRGILKDNYVSSSTMVPAAPRRVSLNAIIRWPDVKLNVTLTAKKSDAQVVNELQQSTLTRTESMANSLTRLLMNKTTWLDPLLIELNVYRDIMAMASVEGTIPEDIRIQLAKWDERVKVTLIPFESTIPEKNLESVKKVCPSNKCIRALISRDSRKVDILMKDPIEDIMFLQVPIRMW